MRTRGLGFVISALMSGAVVSGCAGGGSSATNSAPAVPLAAHQAASAPQGAVRRTASRSTCSGTGAGAFVGGGTSNVAGATNSGVLAGSSNEVCDVDGAIGGGAYNYISSGTDLAYDSFIGSGYFNTISGGAYDSVIGGGNSNVLTADHSVIGGGNQSTLSSEYSVIAGGNDNTLSAAATYSAIGGGSGNTVSGEYGFIGAGTINTVSGEGGFIAAGGYNTVSGEGAVIDGGFNSTASGTFATIPGGYVNSAAGTYSFAAGARATAAQTGTFVWSDGSDGDTILTSSRAYQFLARASGGFTLYTNAASTVGAQLAAGSGTWASLSDRNAKTNVVPLDDATVLDKVAALPISRWSYKSERGVRHVGPMAQDFYAAFRVGEDDKHITSIDEDGVALAAIKALHDENATLRAQLAALKASQTRHDLLVDRRLERLSLAISASREH